MLYLEPVVLSQHSYNQEVIPLVSICCIVFNQQDYIRKALDSFLMQKTTFPVEILIHDDASTDESVSIIKEFEYKYPHLFKPIYQTDNQFSKGVHVNPTFNFSRANGKYIALCEGDDYWTDPFKLQKQVEIMESDERITCVVGGFDIIRFDGTRETVIKKIKPNTHKLGFILQADDLVKGWLTKTLTSMIRVSTLSDYNFEKFEFSRDIHHYVHLLHKGNGFYITESLGVYNQHKGGIHSGAKKEVKACISYKSYKELHHHFNSRITQKLLFKGVNLAIRNSNPSLLRFLYLVWEGLINVTSLKDYFKLAISILQYMHINTKLNIIKNKSLTL